MVIFTATDVDPHGLEAVTVKLAAAADVAGVPEIIPVTGSRLKPAGSAGLTE